MTNTSEEWPAGQTWVFQGTIAEDATAGTHVCTLTITPGAGNELEIMYGSITVGATVTSQSLAVRIDDGANVISELVSGIATTTSSARIDFPNTVLESATLFSNLTPSRGAIVSGTMRIILSVSTAAVSVTQSFGIACRLKGALPTATLNDTIGTSVNTINTNRTF